MADEAKKKPLPPALALKIGGPIHEAFYAAGIKNGPVSVYSRRFDTVEECIAEATAESVFATDLVIYRETIEKVAIVRKSVTAEVWTEELPIGEEDGAE